MTERDLIHEGWAFWSVDPFWLGAQWSCEDKLRLRLHGLEPLATNFVAPIRRVTPDDLLKEFPDAP